MLCCPQIPSRGEIILPDVYLSAPYDDVRGFVLRLSLLIHVLPYVTNITSCSRSQFRRNHSSSWTAVSVSGVGSVASVASDAGD